MIEQPSISFVCCVESGPLEVQTRRMVESLRRWGGKFANAPIYAVTPRFGPPLSSKTRSHFQQFNITHIRSYPDSGYSWFKFLNKPYALVLAEDYITTETVCWLDSDILILQEPEQLVLHPDEDFLGCASDKEMGTAGPSDPYEVIWQEICRAAGVLIDDLPWVVTEQEKEKIRLYWNGGIFVYRRSTGYGKDYLQTCIDLLNNHVVSQLPGYSIGINEMSAIGLAMVRQQLRWRSLPYSHDYSMSSLTHAEWYDESMLQDARILHYHDSMWPKFWDEFLRCLQRTHPDVAEWLAPLGPLQNEAFAPWRMTSRMLKALREHQETEYKKSCKVI